VLATTSVSFNRQRLAGDWEETWRLIQAQFADRLVSRIPDAIVYADRGIRLWNQVASRIFGFAEAEAVGRSLDITIPAGLRERHWQGFRATMSTGRSGYGDGQVRSSWSPMSWRASSPSATAASSSMPRPRRRSPWVIPSGSSPNVQTRSRNFEASNRVRCGLFAGGRWIRTFGSAR
jgi:PAS domain S-box-containing protein